MCGIIYRILLVLVVGSESVIANVDASPNIQMASTNEKPIPYGISSMPSSFAILINLGLSGRIRHLYSSHWHNNKCNSQQIWDPFNNQCRQLFCKDNFEIKHLRCVEKDKTDTNDNETKPFIKFLNSESKFVNVTLKLLSMQELSDKWFAESNDEIVKQFSNQLSFNCSMDVGRLINITVQHEPNQTTEFSINFLLAESNDRKNDDILEELSETIANQKENSFLILDITFWTISIHTTMPEIEDFCFNETDMPIWYWNSDFTILDKSNLTYLFVNKTGRMYYPGEYMGSVLYIQQMDSSGQSTINVSSNAVVCETTLINETCPRIMFNRSEYEFVDGWRLKTIRDGHYHDKYELTDNQSVFVCLKKPKHFNLMSLDSEIQSILSTSLMLLSITLLILVMITFIRLKSIRSTINGFNSINMVICLAVMQISFLTSQYLNQCRLSAVMFHFFILTTIFWSSVIAYDMHRAFNKEKFMSRPNSKQTRIIYCLIAYLLPILIVLIANLSDVFDIRCIKGDYGRIVHSNACWMRNPIATIIYFILPVAVMVFYNLVLFVRIVFNIRNNMKRFSSFKKVTRNDSDSSQVSIISNENGKSKLTFNETSIYIKLSVPLGFTWVIALLSTVIPNQYEILIKVMSYLFIIANTSQGVVLFVAFGVYKKMFSCK